MLEAMIYLISRTVPEDLQPALVVLAFAELPLDWMEVLGRSPEEIIDLLTEFFMTDGFSELSGLSGGDGLFVPKPTRDVVYQGCDMTDLGRLAYPVHSSTTTRSTNSGGPASMSAIIA